MIWLTTCTHAKVKSHVNPSLKHHTVWVNRGRPISLHSEPQMTTHKRLKDHPVTQTHASHFTLLIVSSTCWLCSLSQPVRPSKVLNITSRRCQWNLCAGFHSSVIPQPRCSSRLGTILGMSPPAVLHTSRSCSGKCQPTQMGFDASLSRECLSLSL